MATYHHSFQLGILPERKIDKRALAASYAFIVLVTFVIINLGMLFPDTMPFRTAPLMTSSAPTWCSAMRRTASNTGAWGSTE